MRHLGCFLFLGLVGCSTHPFIESQDIFRPGKLYKDRVTPYGGTCQPQGVIQGPTGPVAPGVAVPVVPPPQIFPGGPGAGPIPAPPGTGGAVLPLQPSPAPFPMAPR